MGQFLLKIRQCVFVFHTLVYKRGLNKKMKLCYGEAESLTNDEQAIEKEEQQAEVFDALGHPTRIVILKALNEGPSGFAELKKKTGIESSGHLLHHLNKLNG
jgi:hypothetical protein